MRTGYLHILWGLLSVLMLEGCRADKVSFTGSRPNIILIMADDLGYSDLGTHGNGLVETPNLDQLANESVQFSQFYVSSVCATTRAALLTGRHFLRTGVSHVHGGKDFLHLDEITLASSLKKAGYTTGMWGKWHSGKTSAYFPWERGFDEAFMAGLYKYRDNKGLMNGQEVQTSGWVTGVLTDYAIDFMKRNRDTPFFAYLPYLSCHAPLDAPEKFSKKYKEKGLSENLATLYGMVDHLDHHIGRLLNSLDELELAQHTIVIFLSDNGPAILNGVLSDKDREIRYVNALRGHKGNLWENGIKSPLFVRWPGSYVPGRVQYLADVCDLYPTLLQLAGTAPDPEDPALDGRSIVPYLTAPENALPAKEVFLYANPGWPPSTEPWTPEGVKDEYRPWKFSGGGNLLFENQIIGLRGERFKLLLNPGPSSGSPEPNELAYVLIDLEADPQEQENVVRSYPEVFNRMETSLRQWHSSVFKDNHAFEMPVFQVGVEREISYEVLAYAPQKESHGVKSAFNYITNFKHKGDSAVYSIDAEQTGLYRVEISYRLSGADSRTMELLFPGYSCQVEFKKESGTAIALDVPLQEGFTNFTLKNSAKDPTGEMRLFKMKFSCLEKVRGA